MRLTTTTSLLVLAITLTSAAGGNQTFAADNISEAKDRAEHALRLYNLGSFDEAIAEFSKAYEIDPSPVLLYNIAHAHRAAGHTEQALFFYRRFLSTNPPEATKVERARQLIRELEDKIAAEKATKDKPATAPAAS